MPRLNFMPFSGLGEAEKATLNEHLTMALETFRKIQEAPMAAKENLIRTDFRAAQQQTNLVTKILQAESANNVALTVMGQRIMESEEVRGFLGDNAPHIKIPEKTKKLKA